MLTARCLPMRHAPSGWPLSPLSAMRRSPICSATNDEASTRRWRICALEAQNAYGLFLIGQRRAAEAEAALRRVIRSTVALPERTPISLNSIGPPVRTRSLRVPMPRPLRYCRRILRYGHALALVRTKDLTCAIEECKESVQVARANARYSTTLALALDSAGPKMPSRGWIRPLQVGLPTHTCWGGHSAWPQTSPLSRHAQACRSLGAPAGQTIGRSRDLSAGYAVQAMPTTNSTSPVEIAASIPSSIGSSTHIAMPASGGNPDSPIRFPGLRYIHQSALFPKVAAIRPGSDKMSASSS